MDNLTACLAYLDKLPNANSGSGGHNATLRAALTCKRFNLNGAEMWTAMQWFNDNRCTPRWSEKELRHKIESVADMAVNKPLGQAMQFKRSARVFMAPPPVVKETDTRPIIGRSAQEEEIWWEKVAAERGVTLADWDNAGDEP